MPAARFPNAPNAELEEVLRDTIDAFEARRLGVPGAARPAFDRHHRRRNVRVQHSNRKFEVQKERVGDELVRFEEGVSKEVGSVALHVHAMDQQN